MITGVNVRSTQSVCGQWRLAVGQVPRAGASMLKCSGSLAGKPHETLECCGLTNTHLQPDGRQWKDTKGTCLSEPAWPRQS